MPLACSVRACWGRLADLCAGCFVWRWSAFVAIDSGVQARISSLHLHPTRAGEELVSVQSVGMVLNKGIQGNRRYFGKIDGRGNPTQRQVSLMEREQITEHAEKLGIRSIEPGRVRANIETDGIQLVPLVGRRIEVGQAILEISAPRDPCAKMDAAAPGLRHLMLENRQGVLARVVRSGVVRVGDSIRVLPEISREL